MFSRLPSGQYGLCFGYLFQVCSLYIPTKDRSRSRGHFWESLVIRASNVADSFGMLVILGHLGLLLPVETVS